MSLFIEPDIVDAGRRRAAVARLREMKVTLPTWSELAHPADIVGRASPDLSRVDPDAPDAANLWRVHWFNDASRKSRVAVPGHVVLPPELTGVPAPIVVLFGRRFPMIGAQ
jgi:hypothetical protein